MKNPSPSSLWTDTWYPIDGRYYSADDPEIVPVRQGDILRPESICGEGLNKPWFGCIVIHPSCEIITQKAPKIQVCRIRRLVEHGENQQAAIVAGETTDRDGHVRVAMAHTFFLPPVPQRSPYSEPMFADLRDVASINREEVSSENRIAIMTHDARVYFIRRYIYWRQRFKLELQDLVDLETGRIGRDANFMGPRPAWAPYTG